MEKIQLERIQGCWGYCNKNASMKFIDTSREPDVIRYALLVPIRTLRVIIIFMVVLLNFFFYNLN